MFRAALVLTLAMPSLFFASTTTIQSHICQTLEVPIITQPTANQTLQPGVINVAGTATAQSSIRVLRNDTQVATTTASSTGNFGASIPVSTGNVSLKVISYDNCSSQTSAVIPIQVTKPPKPNPPTDPPGPDVPPPGPSPLQQPSAFPRSTQSSRPSASGRAQVTTTSEVAPHITLTLDGSLDGSTVASDLVYVSGQTSAARKVRIYVNGMLVSQLDEAATFFGFSVPLEMGKNQLRVVVVGDDGALELEKTLSVTRTSHDTAKLDDSAATGHTSNDEQSGGGLMGILRKNPIVSAIVAAVAVPVVAGSGWALYAGIMRRRFRDEPETMFNNNGFGGRM